MGMPAVQADHPGRGKGAGMNPYYRTYHNAACGEWRRRADTEIAARSRYEPPVWRECWPQVVIGMALCLAAWCLCILWAIRGGRIDG